MMSMCLSRERMLVADPLRHLEERIRGPGRSVPSDSQDGRLEMLSFAAGSGERSQLGGCTTRHGVEFGFVEFASIVEFASVIEFDLAFHDFVPSLSSATARVG